jgi:hypothetical protein
MAFIIKGVNMMEKYEYYTYVCDTEGLLGGKVDANKLGTEINQLGNSGWELVSSVSTNKANGYTRSIVCFFKRRISL